MLTMISRVPSININIGKINSLFSVILMQNAAMTLVIEKLQIRQVLTIPSVTICHYEYSHIYAMTLQEVFAIPNNLSTSG